jgi:hypothetical protein
VRLMRKIGATIEVFIGSGCDVCWGGIVEGGVNVCECIECQV